MILIIGLGNPGEEYENSRHNSGRMAAETIRRKLDFPDFSAEKKVFSLVSRGKFSKKDVVIALPETFMNSSGKAVALLAKWFKASPKDIYILQDDADIIFGKAKISFDKSAAGHKGVKSIIKSLATQKFWRFRIGIGSKRDTPAEKMVLKKFSHDELLVFKKIAKKTAEAMEIAIAEGPERAMNSYN